MCAEMKVRKRSKKGPTALERLERLTARIKEEIERKRGNAARYGVSISGLNTEVADMEGMLERKEMWDALEKGLEILMKLDREVEKARDVFEEAEIVAIRVKEAEMLGADTETARKFLTQAREAADSSSALYFLELARKDADIKITQFTEVRERARKIVEEMEELKRAGIDIEQLSKTFEKARLATQYGAAIHYIGQCEEEIERLRKD